MGPGAGMCPCRFSEPPLEDCPGDWGRRTGTWKKAVVTCFSTFGALVSVFRGACASREERDWGEARRAAPEVSGEKPGQWPHPLGTAEKDGRLRRCPGPLDCLSTHGQDPHTCSGTVWAWTPQSERGLSRQAGLGTQRPVGPHAQFCPAPPLHFLGLWTLEGAPSPWALLAAGLRPSPVSPLGSWRGSRIRGIPRGVGRHEWALPALAPSSRASLTLPPADLTRPGPRGEWASVLRAGLCQAAPNKGAFGVPGVGCQPVAGWGWAAAVPSLCRGPSLSLSHTACLVQPMWRVRLRALLSLAQLFRWLQAPSPDLSRKMPRWSLQLRGFSGKQRPLISRDPGS